MDTAQQNQGVPPQVSQQPAQQAPVAQSVPPVPTQQGGQPTMQPTQQQGAQQSYTSPLQKKHLPKGWSMQKERGPMAPHPVVETPVQQPHEQVVIAPEPAVKEAPKQEVLQPASELHMPELAQEVKEVGVEVKTDDLIKVPQDQQQAGVQPVKDVTPAQKEPSIIDTFPMDETKVAETLKLHKSVADAARWLALMVGRQIAIFKKKEMEEKK